VNHSTRNDHVTRRLAAWLGGETPPVEAAAIADHLETCAACRTEADALRATWDVLAEAAVPETAATVWPAVRARTTARRASRTIRMRHPVWRGALAAAAMAAGVMLGSLVPGGGATAAGEDPDVAAWLDGSSWPDDDGVMVAFWLDAAAGGEETP